MADPPRGMRTTTTTCAAAVPAVSSMWTRRCVLLLVWIVIGLCASTVVAPPKNGGFKGKGYHPKTMKPSSEGGGGAGAGTVTLNDKEVAEPPMTSSSSVGGGAVFGMAAPSQASSSSSGGGGDIGGSLHKTGRSNSGEFYDDDSDGEGGDYGDGEGGDEDLMHDNSGSTKGPIPSSEATAIRQDVAAAFHNVATTFVGLSSDPVMTDIVPHDEIPQPRQPDQSEVAGGSPNDVAIAIGLLTKRPSTKEVGV